MAVQFPAIRPTTRSFEAAEFASVDPDYAGTVAYPRLLGSKPGKAKLSMTFENIADADAALIIASYLNSLSGFFPLSMPAEVVAGVSDEELAIKIKNADHMDWHFDGPPRQSSVIGGISTVQVELVADF